MLTMEDLTNDEDYEDIKEDVREECQKFGNVIGFEIPRPNGEEPVPGLLKIFVEFADTNGAGQALGGLGGRKFDSRTVIASVFDEEKFAARDFSG